MHKLPLLEFKQKKILLWINMIELIKIKNVGYCIRFLFLLQFFECIKKLTQIYALCISSSKYLGGRYFVYSTASLIIQKKITISWVKSIGICLQGSRFVYDSRVIKESKAFNTARRERIWNNEIRYKP